MNTPIPITQDFRFHSGIEAIPDAAIILSPDLVIMSGNKKAQRLLGVRFPDDVGKHIEQLLIYPEFSDYLQKGKFETPCTIT
jgi:two-component system phosphate regulon sensor histidine kinase PhoR